MVSVDTQMLRVEEEDDFFVVELNRPEKLNAIDTELMGGLYEFWTDVDANPTKGVLLTGRGESTCAGADIDVLGSDEMDSFSEKEHEVFDVIRRYPLPTVMACKGAAVGMGFILALECDLAILGEDTTLSYPEFSMGLYSNLGVELLAHHVGVQFAKEVVLTGEPVSPERARSHGIAADVVPEGDVDDRAIELIEELTEHDPSGIALIKDRLRFEFSPSDYERVR